MKARVPIYPPRLANRLLEWYCSAAFVEDLQGDMEELFYSDLQKMSPVAAKLKYWRHVLSLILSYAIKKRKRDSAFHPHSYSSIHPVMLHNYFKIAGRNFLKQKTYTFLNVLGLAVGMSASLLIFQYIKYERSFDSFHSKIRDLYRIQYNGWQNGKLEFESALAVPPVGPALKNHFPEVLEYTRFFPAQGAVSFEDSRRGLISFYETKMFYADASIFRMFDFPLIKGDAATCLKGTNKIILCEKVAKKYFGEENPVGRLMKWNSRNYEVTGVLRDVPENSHLLFDLLISFETLANETNNLPDTGWGWYDFYVYVLLRPETNVAELQSKWNAWVANDRGEEWKKENAFQEFILQPMGDIHLNSHLLYEAQPTEQRDGSSISALSLIAIFIIAIALINYINLATARSINRANEVGIRKVVGAHRRQLIGQFIMESALLNAIAFAIAIMVVRVAWKEFSALSGWNIPLDFIFQADFWKLAILIFAGGTLLSGFYPALVLSSFRPILVLKGKILHSSGGGITRRALVLFQFVTSLLLMIGSFIVYDQVNFMKNKNLGMDIRNKLVLRTPTFSDNTYFTRVQSFKDQTLKVPGIKSIATANNVPGDEIVWTSHVGRISGGPEGDLIITSLGIDDQYVPTFDIRISEGRNFDHQTVREGRHILVNKSLVKDLEFPDARSAIGEKLRVRQSMSQYDTLEIVGVIDDYHHMSLKEKMLPTIFRYTPYSTYFTLKIESPDYGRTIASLEDQWKAFFPGNPFEYFILDQFFNHQYEKEDRFATLFNLFTGLAIFVALLGLFGLASFVTLQRTKEIGIRKVLGAPVSGIVFLLSRGFLQPVLIANVIAWPVAWYVMERWLEQFPYRTAINPFIFPAAGSCVLALAFLFVGIQTLKAAMTEPVKTLKYE